MMFGRVQLVWWGWSWAFCRGIYPRPSLPLFRWFALGPLEVRIFRRFGGGGSQ